jgi:hypothetical protein
MPLGEQHSHLGFLPAGRFLDEHLNADEDVTCLMDLLAEEDHHLWKRRDRWQLLEVTLKPEDGLDEETLNA